MQEEKPEIAYICFIMNGQTVGTFIDLHDFQYAIMSLFHSRVDSYSYSTLKFGYEIGY